MILNKRGLIILGILSFSVLALSLRGFVIRIVADRYIDKIEEQFLLEIKYDRLSIFGIAGVEINNFTITPKGEETLFRAKKIKARLNFWRALFLRPDLSYLELEEAGLTFIKNGPISNFEFLYNKVSSDVNSERKDIKPLTDFSKPASSLYSLFLDLIPSNATLRNVYISYSNGDYNLKVTLEESGVIKDKYSSVITTDENGTIERLRAEGSLNDKERKITATFHPESDSVFSLPFIGYRWGASLIFDTLSLEITGGKREGAEVNFSGSASASSLAVFHKSLSPYEIVLHRGKVDYNIHIGNNYAELDSSSVIQINSLQLSPWLKAQKGEKWIFSAHLEKIGLDAGLFFKSLPRGLFAGIEEIKAEGSLDFNFNLQLDMNQPDSLKLESSLNSKDFRIIKQGEADLRIMSEEFIHTIYENGEAVREIVVGPGNPGFTPLERIPEHLKTAILQSEDGGFYFHKGFVPGAIRDAMVENIKRGKFARGGSSISMQLVKNVYLNKHKTLARKFEEMIIVWLIENNRLVSKERMFEVYLNIIEWGPGIYGITEASRFWFSKEPWQLSINESIFLASIIPAPKRALRNFNPDYSLKAEMNPYFKLLAERLRVKGIIGEDQESRISADINVSESVKKMLDLVNKPD
ncbi:MAG: hypothetical protein BGO30_00965 [Bacteroidetes bacterium 41-46]|nr:MAG: hypothetical protein BGO30_00965 [Bacteroidetes bacterium 41-46]